MSDIVTLLSEYKSELEKEAFIEKQHETISSLLKKNKSLEEEVKHLKQLLTSTIEPMNKVETIIITPEEHLIESQIEMVRDRGLGTELVLEDVKKLDILLKNKKIIKDKKEEVIKADSKRFDRHLISTAELVKLAVSKQDNE